MPVVTITITDTPEHGTDGVLAVNSNSDWDGESEPTPAILMAAGLMRLIGTLKGEGAEEKIGGTD
jgi:hypothetical protein